MQEKDKEDTSLLSEDQIDTCPTAGFENIKKFLKESSDRMVAVRSGMSYEEHVRLAEVIFPFLPLSSPRPLPTPLSAPL